MGMIHYDIPDRLHRRAKAAAATQGVTLKAFLIGALEEATAYEEAVGETGRKR